MRNNKGIVFFTLASLAGTIHVIGLLTVIACVWHIPAWSKAKAEGKTAEYQAQKMWPQQEFAKLPGGNSNPNTVALANGSGNRGNFVAGNM